MARAVLSRFCAVAFLPSELPALLEVLPLKRILSTSHLILPLLALASAHCLSAQTLVVDKPSLTFSGQFGGPAVTQTVNVTSSTGASIPFILVAPPGFAVAQGQRAEQRQRQYPRRGHRNRRSHRARRRNLFRAISAVIGGSANNPPIAVTFTVSAIGVNPASLAFTYTVGSSTFPATQVLTLSGAATQCTATAATTSGGSWFSLLQNTCSSPGSLTVLFNTSVIAGLAPNTYNGTITITPAPAGAEPRGRRADHPHRLADAPGHRQPDVPRLQLADRCRRRKPQPDIYHLHYRYPAARLQLHPDVAVWPTISTISPSSGTISATGTAQITYTVNPNGLAVGTYNGKLTLLTPGGSPRTAGYSDHARSSPTRPCSSCPMPR